MRTDEALRYAQERDLDLVEVAPEARPPVCRVLDYSKYKYEQSQKQKAARKHQQQITIREIKFRPKIAEQDYATKKRHVERFLKHKDKVKVTIMFRGREVTHPERGQMILDRLAEELTELAIIEQRPNLDGRNMTMLLGPSKAVLSGTLGKDGEDGESAENGEGAHGRRGGHRRRGRRRPRPRRNGADPVAAEMAPKPRPRSRTTTRRRTRSRGTATPKATSEAPRATPCATAVGRKPWRLVVTPSATAEPSAPIFLARGDGGANRLAPRAQSRRSAIASCTVTAAPSARAAPAYSSAAATGESGATTSLSACPRWPRRSWSW